VVSKFQIFLASLSGGSSDEKWLLLATAILSVMSAFGHHSVAADFDVSRTVRINGTISKLEFSNPHHVLICLDVKNVDGV
jgi:hypothetical protein